MRYRYLLGLLPLLLLFGACDKKDSDRAAWTILVYMAADNGLSSNADAVINEMERAELAPGVRVVIEIDRSEDAANPDAQRLLLQHDETDVIASKVLADIGEIDTSKPETLSGFIRWGAKNYPADNYGLVIWSHGTGWYKGTTSLCPDNDIPGGGRDDMRVSNGDFRAALQNGGKQFRFLLLDACLMQTMEVLGETLPLVDYVIGSEDEVPVDGFPYTSILERFNETTSPLTSILPIPADYIANVAYEAGSMPLSCSVADMSAYEAWLPQCASFVTVWEGDALNTEPVYRECETFNDAGNNIDVHEFFARGGLLTGNPEMAQAMGQLAEAADSVFIASRTINHGEHTAGRGTLWFPLDATSFNNTQELYSGFVFAQSQWQEFLRVYFNGRG